MKQCFAILLYFIVLSNFSQNRDRLDSLLQVEKLIKEDTLLIKNYIRVSENFIKINYDSSLFYSYRAIQLALKIKNDKFYAIAQREKLLNLKARFTPKEYLDSILSLKQDVKIQKDEHSYSIIFQELGITYRKLGNYDKSISSLLEALKLSQKINFQRGIYNAYNRLANTYSQAGMSKKSYQDLERALKYYESALMYCDKQNFDQTNLILSNQAVTYFNIGQIKLDSLATKKSIEYYKKVLAYRISINDVFNVGETYNNMGAAYQDLSVNHKLYQYTDSAKINYEKAIDLVKNSPDSHYSYLSNYGSFLGHYGTVKNDPVYLRKGVEYLKKALNSSEKYNDVVTSMHCALNIAITYSNLNRPDSSIKYFNMHLNFKDIVLSEENKQIAEDLAAKYDSDLKDSENNNLKAQAELREEVISKKSNTIKIMVFASIIMLGLVVLVLISRQKINKSRDLIKKQQIETETQKQIIQDKNTEIIASINYARRIQQSLLPTERYIERIFNSKKEN